MRKLYFIILLVFTMAGCDGLSDMADDLERKVPICVDETGGNDANDGRGWKNAVATLDQALVLVDNGGEIWVKQDYTTLTNISITKPVKIYGGFDGTEGDLDDRPGDLKSEFTGSVANVFAVTSTGVIIKNIRFNNTSSRAIALSGSSSATIENCDFIASQQTAVYVYMSKAVLRNCLFDGNIAGGTFDGGAVNVQSAEIEIIDCNFTGNNTGGTSHDGGALYIFESAAKITGSNFNGNSAGNGSGGAIYSDNSTIEINGSSTFSSNTSDGDGGAVLLSNAVAVIEDSSLSSNSCGSSNGGGAIYFIGASSGRSLSISSSSLNSNTSGGTGGGAIYFSSTSDSNLSISNTVFDGNQNDGIITGGVITFSSTSGRISINSCSVKNNTSGSGAIYISNSIGSNLIINSDFNNNHAQFSGGAITCFRSSLEIRNSFIVNNNLTSIASSTSGGGIFIRGEDSSGTSMKIINTMFYNNRTGTESSSQGGGLYVTSDTLTPEIYISNCTFYLNQSSDTGGGVVLGTNCTGYLYNTVFYNNTHNSGATLSSIVGDGTLYSYNNAWDVAFTWGSHFPSNNQLISSNPFASTTYGTSNFLYLVSGSACIDAGTNSVSGFTMPSTDLAGKIRIVNNTVDIGCYESQ